MAVEKRWIKFTITALSVFLLIFVVLQLTLTGIANVALRLTISVPRNAAFEYSCIAMFLTPAVWIGFSAAMSRHRGVYITLTVFVSLSLLASLALIVYEAYEFGSRFLYTTTTEWVNAVMITKLVCWSIIAVLLMVLLGIAIASISMKPKDGRHGFEYYNNKERFAAPTYSLPPEYMSNPMKAKPQELPRDYPRMAASPYYPKYY